MKCKKFIIAFCLATVCSLQSQAQSFHLFSSQVKTEYPSVVYDFLERYLYEIDQAQRQGNSVEQKLRDDKVIFLKGSAGTARVITPRMSFSISNVENKFYEVSWTDDLGVCVLSLAFPVQYELILNKTKVELENELKTTLANSSGYLKKVVETDSTVCLPDNCLMSDAVSNYYIESLNTATYHNSQTKQPTFVADDRGHSAANLFQGCIEEVSGYTLDIEQNLYGFNSTHYALPLAKWLAYCQTVDLKVFFAIEEEQSDCLKALLIAQSQDLGFNHMLSLVIPNDFVTNPSCRIKGSLNAYIPTQNIKDLYQEYVKKPKKKIW